MSIKLEITGNYLKVTDGVNTPSRFPYRDIAFQSETPQTINLFKKQESYSWLERMPFLGVASKGTVTIDTVTPTKASGTVTCATAVVGNTVTVNGLLYTAVAGVKTDNTKFSIDTSNTATATDLADSINNDVRVGTLNDVTASAALGVVTIVQTVGGLIGNATTLASSGATLAVSEATFTGGLDDAEISGITVNAIQIMSGAVTSADKNLLASEVASNINAHTSIPDYTATSIEGVVTITPATVSTTVNGFVIASTAVKATKTDVNMAGATANILTSAGTPFADFDALILWLEKNTGGELIA